MPSASLCIHGATFAVAMLVFWVLNLFGRLRISKEGELEGMDLHEHGIPAYPEYVISALAAPRVTPRTGRSWPGRNSSARKFLGRAGRLEELIGCSKFVAPDLIGGRIVTHPPTDLFNGL